MFRKVPVGGMWLGESELGVCGALAQCASPPELLLPLALAVSLCNRLLPASLTAQTIVCIRRYTCVAQGPCLSRACHSCC